jgi:tetratricopeptide (TPR) repeat protein
MPPAQRFPCRRALIALPFAGLLAACGARVETLPLDGDDPAPAAAEAAPQAPADAAATLFDEALPEIDPTAAADTAVGGGSTTAPAAAAGAALTSPSPLASLGADTPPNVAAATRLAESARVKLAASDEGGALELLERAIAIDPNNPYAYYFLAEVHLHTRTYDQAIAFAERAASLSGRSADWTSRAWALQGNAFEAAGRFGDARQAYLRAVRAAPGNLAAAVGLVRVGGGSETP